MGHVPLPPPPSRLTIDQQIAALEPRLGKRRSFWRWRRRDAYSACCRLIVLREHALFGLHDVVHAGVPPSPPPRMPADPTYRLV